MLAFVDESGDAGLKIDQGSSPHFVVALVVFDDPEEATRLDRHFDSIRESLEVRKDFEFKFQKMNAIFRRRVLEEVAQFSFRYYGIVINKANLSGPGFAYPGSFYKYTCKLVCGNAKECLRDAKVTIDGSGTKEFKRQLATYLRKNVNDKTCGYKHIRRVKMEDSQKSNLLQLADVIAGAIARSYKNKGDKSVYRQLMVKKEVYVQVWPK
jgi:hypothetical protein